MKSIVVFLLDLLNVMCMSGLSAYMYMYNVCGGQNIGSSGAGVTNGCEPHVQTPLALNIMAFHLHLWILLDIWLKALKALTTLGRDRKSLRILSGYFSGKGPQDPQSSPRG